MRFSSSPELRAAISELSIPPQINAMCEDIEEQVEIEIQRRGNKVVLYIHTGGVSILRISQLNRDQIKLNLGE